MPSRRIFRTTVFWVLKKLLCWLLLPTVLVVGLLRWVPPPTSSFMLHCRGKALLGRDDAIRLRYQWVAWERISPNAAIALVAAEDQKFPRHSGFDFESITDAVKRDRGRGRPRGASTITQQVAKNLFLWPGRSLARKGIEAYFSVLLEAMWPKRRILEVYLNIAEFGPGIYGVKAASERFFGKPPSRLSIEEASLLAAVLPNPKRYRVDRPSDYVTRRAAKIREQVRLLGGEGYLSGL